MRIKRLVGLAPKLKSHYSITIAYNTLDRWLKQHRSALLAGTLERPMNDEDGKPEDYAEQIAAIRQSEPNADYKRLHTELKLLHQVVVPHRRRGAARRRRSTTTRAPQPRLLRLQGVEGPLRGPRRHETFGRPRPVVRRRNVRAWVGVVPGGTEPVGFGGGRGGPKVPYPGAPGAGRPRHVRP